ncbi:hypothetical protein [Kribbella sp. NBC_00889]|uniref:hypothetical protein n=1 Tax=Kribbella sp. NBC_00889 TaxID=2975974 RepID=UPI00386E6B6E|nr:hypothetical protein OG817_09435 [Kribbella sp. NBC_00889]
MPRPKNILLRLSAVLAVGLGLVLTVGGTAGAAGPEPVSSDELSKATTAAHSPTALGLLGKVSTGSAKTAATVSQDTHAVYALNPAFVRDASAPVATFWYAATPASKGGQALTVYTAPDQAGAWQAVNVASGNTEARMFAAARGAVVFTEPQIGAWYALTGTQIRPLNASATKSIGPAPITIAAYNELVSTRYSDKLPGTHYSHQGVAGGYDTTAAAAPTDTYNDLILRSTVGAIALLGLACLYHRRVNRRSAATPRNAR